MVNYTEIQIAYIQLYKVMRRYIWSISAVEALAELEVEASKVCADMNMLRAALSRLKYEVFEVARDDEDLQLVLANFDKLIASSDGTYVKLTSFKEVVPV